MTVAGTCRSLPDASTGGASRSLPSDSAARRGRHRTRRPPYPACEDGAHTEVSMSQLAQVAGAIAILVAFAAAQLRLVSVQSRLYLILNLAGSAVLAFDAWHERQWGF